MPVMAIGNLSITAPHAAAPASKIQRVNRRRDSSAGSEEDQDGSSTSFGARGSLPAHTPVEASSTDVQSALWNLKTGG